MTRSIGGKQRRQSDWAALAVGGKVGRSCAYLLLPLKILANLNSFLVNPTKGREWKRICFSWKENMEIPGGINLLGMEMMFQVLSMEETIQCLLFPSYCQGAPFPDKPTMADPPSPPLYLGHIIWHQFVVSWRVLWEHFIMTLPYWVALTAWLIASLSYTNSFKTRLWSMTIPR